jgi:hypothetical protein
MVITEFGRLGRVFQPPWADVIYGISTVPGCSLLQCIRAHAKLQSHRPRQQEAAPISSPLFMTYVAFIDGPKTPCLAAQVFCQLILLSHDSI